MKATKHEVKIVVEVLSVDSVYALVGQALRQIQSEVKSGELTHDDGDFVKWERIETPVTF